MTDQNYDNTTVKKMTRTRKQMEDEIEKAAKESTKAEHYTCPFCCSHEPKAQVDLNIRSCEEIHNSLTN